MYVLKLENITNNINQYEELVKLFLTPDEFKIITDEDEPQESTNTFVFDGDKNKIKREIYSYLSKETGEMPKWGILTGIRPVKLAGELYEKMQDRAAVKEHLNTEYLMSDEKADLILDMYEYQQSELGKPPVESAGVYIGIPFCPTRCLYCSFTSNPYKEDKAEAYLEALFKEISYVGQGMKEKGIIAESVYIGGGTPTSLDPHQLDRLLTHIRESFDLSQVREFTVEAGRPDTITGEKLQVLLDHGVERISVNPQTMHDDTLVTIGRAHTVQQTRDAFELADKYNIPVINADLIAGLPDETAEDFIETLHEVLSYGPENITLHTLAVKRSSRLKELDENFHKRQPLVTETMLVDAKKILTEAGYRPYYLYRQKNIAGSTENIGYCKDDTLSLYNVRIMEEAQSIIALGAGGITKVYYPEENRLERIPNVSNYEIYIERIDEMLERKEKELIQEVTIMLTNAPKGTKDTLPSQVYKWHFVEKAFADICAKYGFKEIRTPMFEHTELFARGVGDTTDIVQKEMYTFQDYAKRSITLKPEGTSPVARSFVEHKAYADVQPSKYYYNTPCFRLKPQSGRLREFHQFGIEVFGTPNMLADAEVICLANDFLQSLGITDIELQINSVGCPHCRENHRKALKEFLASKYDDLCDTCKDRYDRNPMRILDCKSKDCQELVKGAPMMIDYLCDDCKEAFEDVQKNLTSLGVEFVVNPGIVRGLDYYTKTAFEFITTSIGAQGTVCGGGRYDNLMEALGGPPIPGVGFGLGIERLLLTMEAAGIEIPEPDSTDVFIAVMGDDAKAFGLGLMRKLRQAGVHAEMDVLARNIKGQFKYANRINAKKTIVIGDNELAEKKVAIKDMATSQQTEIAIDDILTELTK